MKGFTYESDGKEVTASSRTGEDSKEGSVCRDVRLKLSTRREHNML
jgi:hypothetical protein